MRKLGHFIRTHLGPVIAGTAATIVLVGGTLILVVMASGGPGPAAASLPAPTTTAPSPGRGGTAAARGVRGQIATIQGNTWTVTTSRGASVTVTVTAQTQFGKKASPLQASDFAVGDRIVAAGTRTETSVTATRIAKASSATTPPSTVG